jgi:hypothetical protein
MKNLSKLIENGVDERVMDLFVRLAGDKADYAAMCALELIKEGKQPMRAMADALDMLSE